MKAKQKVELAVERQTCEAVPNLDFREILVRLGSVSEVPEESADCQTVVVGQVQSDGLEFPVQIRSRFNKQ